MLNIKPMPSGLTLGSIFALSFFCAFGNPLVIPLFPQIMAHFGITPLETTLMISMYALPGAIIIPILGILQDRIGRKPLLLLSIVVCFISCLGMSMTESYSALLLWRLVMGASVTPMEAMSSTLISDNFSGAERGRYIGMNASSMYIGVAAFPILSTVTMLLVGWRASLLLPCILAVPLFIMCLFMPMPYKARSFSWPSYRQNIRKTLFSRRLLSLFGVRMGGALIMFGAVHSYMPFLVAEKLGGTAGTPGIIMAVFSCFLALGSLAMGAALKRFGLIRLGTLTGLLFTLGMAGFLFAPTIGILLPHLCLFGIGNGLLMAATVTQVANCTTDNTRGTTLSLLSTFFRMSQAITPFLCSMLYFSGGFDLLYGTAVVASLGLTLLIRYSFGLAQNDA